MKQTKMTKKKDHVKIYEPQRERILRIQQQINMINRVLTA